MNEIEKISKNHIDSPEAPEIQESPEKPQVMGVIIHSFFVIPFLIAFGCIIVFFMVSLLVREPKTVYDYLNDIKTGGATKRWQSAFELSKILANKELIPQDERFVTTLTNAFEYAVHPEDYQVRYYLATAMATTQNPAFVPVLVKHLKDLADTPESSEKIFEMSGMIKSLGILKAVEAIALINNFLEHPEAILRLNAVIALGNIADESCVALLQKRLQDEEPNIRWDAAIALAKMNDLSGKKILLQLLDREYLNQFPNVKSKEQNHAILITIAVASYLQDQEIHAAISKLATDDQNMKVRTAAMEAMKRYKE